MTIIKWQWANEVKLCLEQTVWYGGVTNHVDKRGGVAQMTTTLNNSYLFSKSVHIGGAGVKIVQNSVHVVCTQPLTGVVF